MKLDIMQKINHLSLGLLLQLAFRHCFEGFRKSYLSELDKNNSLLLLTSGFILSAIF